MSDEPSGTVHDEKPPVYADGECFTGYRAEIIERWCWQHGITPVELTSQDMLEIRSLPNWKVHESVTDYLTFVMNKNEEQR